MITVKNKHRDPVGCCDVYIGRGSPVGNPWSHMDGTKAKFKASTREESIEKYKEWLNRKLIEGDPEVSDFIRDLVIKNLTENDFSLVCFCSPLPCHGDVIKEKVLSMKWVPNWFSNMKPFDEPIIYQGIKFRHPENFYQAMKLEKNNKNHRSYIASLSPHDAKKKIRHFPIRKGWTSDLAKHIMDYILRIKFAHGTDWYNKLMSTKGEIIEWNNWGDKKWGRCIFSGEGENWLGKILMNIRSGETNFSC